MIDRFFRPFFGGVFLDRELQTSSRMMNFVFRMFSLGQACLPENGMEAIPNQLAAKLEQNRLRLNTRVKAVNQTSIVLSNGERLEADHVVVAVEGPSAVELLGSHQSDYRADSSIGTDESHSIDPINAAGNNVTCHYYAADRSPVNEAILILNGDGVGPINNLCFPTDVAPSYGSPGRCLVSATSFGGDEQAVKAQLRDWFGASVDGWNHLRTYSIPYALPNQAPPILSQPMRNVRWRDNVWLCGDHRDNASLQGAMVSGRRTAEALLKVLG